MASTDLGPLIADLRAIVGRRHVLTTRSATRRYRTGYRAGEGTAAAVIRPGSLVEQWRVLQRLVAADAIVIHQAANTGLTGGSTPAAEGYDRPVFVLSTLRIRGIHLIDGGRQVVCLPGTTLYQLETTLRPLGREPHSVIGSSCLGASVIGGVCNNSGGALVRRGPAYTELALYAQVAADGTLHLVNHLGIALGHDAEAMLDRLDTGRLGEIDDDRRAASDRDYARHVRDIDAPTPARFNADPRRLFEASGSAGRIAVFAVRLDTFPAETGTHVYYVGTNDPDDFTALRRAMLRRLDTPPIAAEYMHREAFDVTTRYGRDTVQAIRLLGTDRLPWLFAAKDRVDRLLGHGAADRLLQRLGRLLPDPLPARLRDFRDRFEHHLMLKVDQPMAAATVALLRTAIGARSGDWFEADPHEGRIAFLHRFAAAGAAVRYRAVHAAETQEVLALDIALPRSARDWFEVLPPDIAAACVRRLYYGHLFCHVLHQDYVLAKGADPAAIKAALLERLAARGARYPAEHNVGTTYAADPDQLAFYRTLDPANVLNPGIGRSSRRRGWR